MNSFLGHTKILVLGAHPDDFEIGCGGTLIKYMSHIDINVAVFSDRMDTGEKRNLQELSDANKVLNIPKNCVRVFDIPTRIFHDYRSKIRNYLFILKEEINPDLVLCPAINDIHQDHFVLAEEAIRIFREKSIFGYEVVRSSYKFHANLHVSLTQQMVTKKIEAVQCYKSQFSTTKSGAYYFNENVLKGLMFARGGQFGIEFAEGFEIYHMKL